MWFIDYDEFMTFKCLRDNALRTNKTSFTYDEVIYSMDCANALIASTETVRV